VLPYHMGAEVEMKEKKKALRLQQEAVEEGIAPGGGVVFAILRRSESLDGLKGLNEDETTGIQIVKEQWKNPLDK